MFIKNGNGTNKDSLAKHKGWKERDRPSLALSLCSQRQILTTSISKHLYLKFLFILCVCSYSLANDLPRMNDNFTVPTRLPVSLGLSFWSWHFVVFCSNYTFKDDSLKGFWKIWSYYAQQSTMNCVNIRQLVLNLPSVSSQCNCVLLADIQLPVESLGFIV